VRTVATGWALTLRITYSDHPLGGWHHRHGQRRLDLHCHCTRPVAASRIARCEVAPTTGQKSAIG
jgi:hypothetical protein